MEADWEAARLLMLQAAWMADNRKANAMEASMAKAAAEGGKVVQPENRPAWEAGARTVWTSFAPKLGGIGKVEAIAAA